MKKVGLILGLLILSTTYHSQSIPQKQKQFTFLAVGASDISDLTGLNIGQIKVNYNNVANSLPSACTYALQSSFDKVNFTDITGLNAQSCTGAGGQSTLVAVPFPFVRINLSAYTATAAGARINIGFTAFSEAVGSTSTNPQFVNGSFSSGVIVAPFTDRSSSITAGGTSQTLAIVNSNRKRIVIQNPCTSTSQGIITAENLFINFTSAASLSGGNSFELQPCGSYDSGPSPVSGELISVNATTTGHQFIAKEQ